MSQPLRPGITYYYRILDFDKPYAVLPKDAILVIDLPLGRLELRHKGDHLEVSALQQNSRNRLTVEPVVSNLLRLRLEGPYEDC